MLALLTATISIIGVAQASVSTVSIFGSATPTNVADTDTQAVELGTKFKVTKVGWISGVRFYKSKANIGTHTGTVWLSTGEKLGTVTFKNESGSGWQTATLPTALLVRPDLTYVVSYHTNVGHYSGDQYYFAGKGAGKNAVRALADGVVGSSGVYKYGATTAFPTSTYRATNYYVDVQFKNLTDAEGRWNNTTLDPNTTDAPASSTTAPATTSTTTAPTTSTTSPPANPGNGVEGCGLYANAEPCWAANTGVLNTTSPAAGDRWTEAQMQNDASVNGHRPSEQLNRVTGQYDITTSGTAGNPRVYENLYIKGCLRIAADHVLIRNVFVEWNNPNSCTTVGGHNPNGIGASIVSSGNDLVDVQIEDSEFEGGPHVGGGPGLLVGSGLNLRRINAHGSPMVMGYNSRTTITYSYIHDATDGHNPCYFSGGCGPGQDLHSDVLWEQGISDWSITHSFVYHSHYSVPQSAGSCLCDHPTSNVFLEDVYFNGNQGASITFCGNTGTGSVVWHRLHLANDTICDPTIKSNMVPWGSWQPNSWDANGVPVMPATRCAEIYFTSASGVNTDSGHC